MQRKGNLSALLVGMQTGKVLWKTVWKFLKKLKMKLPFDPVIPLLGIYPKNPKTPIQKNLCTQMFIAVVCTLGLGGKEREGPNERTSRNDPWTWTTGWGLTVGLGGGLGGGRTKGKNWGQW